MISKTTQPQGDKSRTIKLEEFLYLLDVEALDLGLDVRSVGLELVEADENREPVRGEDAARIWSRILPAVAGGEPWSVDFFSHLDRVRDYLRNHDTDFREAGPHFISVPTPEPKALEALLARFQSETFGVRAGALLTAGDPPLEGELARRGADAYDAAFPNYYFCAICAFEDGSLVLLSDNLRSSDVIRKVRPALEGLDVKTQLPS
jgi:hypothetical protein